MKLIYVMLMLFIFLLSIIQFGNKKWYNPSTLFVGFWCVIAMLSYARWFDLKDVSDTVYLYLLLGTSFFCIGGYISKHIKIKDINAKTRKVFITNIGDNPHYIKIFKILLCFAIAIFFINTIPNLVLYRQGYTIAQVRYQDIEKIVVFGRFGNLLAILNTFFAYPFLAATVVFLTSKYMLEKSLIKLLFPIGIVILLILGIGAREIIIYALVTSAMGIVVLKQRGIKIPKNLYLSVILFIIIFFVVSVGRDIKGLERNIRSIYHYMCSSLVLFDYTLDNTTFYYGMHTYGAMSFLGFLRPVYNFFGLIGIKQWPIFDVAEQFQLDLQYTVIHTTTTGSGYFNYFATCFAYFYKDFGTYGIIVMSTIYGMISTYVFKRVMKDPRNLRYLTLYLFLVCGIFASMDDFQFINIRNAMPIIYILLFVPDYLVVQMKEVTQ